MFQLLYLGETLGATVESVLFFMESRTDVGARGVHLVRAILYAFLAIIHGVCLFFGHV